MSDLFKPERIMHILLSFCLVLASSSVIAQACTDLAGSWQNELGSVLVIAEITQDDRLIGEYRSSSGVDGKIFPLQGWVNNTDKSESPPSIAFIVRWEGYGSITSWTGSCAVDDQGPYLKTLWHLVRPDAEHEWERIIANSSTFRPLEN